MIHILDTTALFLGAVKSKSYKCPFCIKNFKNANALYLHVDTLHKENVPNDTTTKKYIYDLNHPGDHLCQICGVNKCVWKEKIARYSTICDDPSCREEARRRFLENYKKKNGKDHSISDPKIQREMIKHKKNSGYYEFKNGGKVLYASTYEKDFLEFCDLTMEFTSDMVEECNLEFEYFYEGKKHYYLPDYYIRCYDLIVEIKADDDISHPKILAIDKETEKLKDKAVIKDGTHNFIKICDKKYEQFVDLINILKDSHIEGKTSSKNEKYIVIPERSNTIRGFVPPKLNFIHDKALLLENPNTMALFSLNKDKNDKIKFTLFIEKDYVDEELQNDELFEDNSHINCKEYEISYDNEVSIRHAFDEFKNYYTKKYEKFINQDYFSPKLELRSSKLKYFDLKYLKEEKKTKVLEYSTKYMDSNKIKYLTVKKRSGYGILIYSNELDNKKKIIKDLIKYLYKKDNLIKEDVYVEKNQIVIPGSVDGNSNVVILDRYTNFEL